MGRRGRPARPIGLAGQPVLDAAGLVDGAALGIADPRWCRGSRTGLVWAAWSTMPTCSARRPRGRRRREHGRAPRLPIRRMVSLLDLNHACGLSNEALVERCAENVVWPFLSGQT